ncbi:MAG: TAXI family TRAP transporter solute-binding subunit [Stellaceae bacterium]
MPRVVVMATGAAGGAYSEYGERYREIFARQGVTLTLLHSRGSIENLAMLRRQDFGVTIALVQSGLTDAEKSPELVSLGTISYEPVWIFWRGEPSTRGGLDQLHGKRISIGPADSGMRHLALELLARNEIDEGNTELLPFTPDEAAERLIAGDIQAAIILAAPDSPAVQRLLGSPNVGLISLTRADAYVALYPFLSKVVLPAGFTDMAHDRPSADVDMVAVKASLVVRRELQSAVQYLLLDAAAQIHSHAGVFQKAGEFSAGEATDLPLSDSARQFYKSGMPFLQRYLPLWLAVLTEQLAILLIPFAGLAYGLLRVLPAVYGWGVQRRIYRLYGELKLLELKLEDHSSEQRSGALLAELSGLEDRVSHLRVPVSFAHMLYTLRHNIKLVSERLDQG